MTDAYTQDCARMQELSDIAEDEQEAGETREERRERMAELRWEQYRD